MFGDLLAFGAVSTFVWITGVLFVFLCLFLVALVLLQKGRGDGLSSALGGAGGQSAFGSKTGDTMTVVTVSVVVIFFIFAVGLSMGFKPETDASEAVIPTITAPADVIESTTADTTQDPTDTE